MPYFASRFLIHFNEYASSAGYSRLSRWIVALFLLMISIPINAAPTLKPFPDYQIKTIAKGLNHPWSLAFLPTGELLVTERSGQLSQVSSTGVLTSIKGLPNDIYVKSQAGLLDIALHPDYAQNGWVYLSYASGSDKHNALKVIRIKFKDGRVTEQQVLFTLSPDKDTPVHFGGRLVFLADNSLLISTGDGFDYREQAQHLDSQLGKMIRIADDGQLPSDNPFNGKGKLADAIYTLGHRNPQGLVYDPMRKQVFSSEHGPAGGDEVNIIVAGNNYGWPIITYGRDYSGARISPFTEYPGMQQPLVDWTPSNAPSGLAVYYGEMFTALKGDLLSGSLKFRQVIWLQMKGNQVAGQVSLFKELDERIRDVRVHPDGSIYLLTDSDEGRILRVVKK